MDFTPDYSIPTLLLVRLGGIDTSHTISVLEHKKTTIHSHINSCMVVISFVTA